MCIRDSGITVKTTLIFTLLFGLVLAAYVVFIISSIEHQLTGNTIESTGQYLARLKLTSLILVVLFVVLGAVVGGIASTAMISPVRKMIDTIDSIDADYIAALERHTWHGNVRELRNAVERSMIMADGNSLTFDCLAPEFHTAAVGCAPDSLTLDGQTYKDSFNHGAERWTLAGVLEQSSNIGTILASDSFSDQKRYEYLTKFGIGQPSGLNLPGESQGLLTQPQTWDGRTRNTVLFGQGYTVNALQMTNAIAVIANQGVLKPQSIIKSITTPDGKSTTPEQKESTRVIDEEASKQILNAMESVSEHYSSQGFAGVKGYRVASKSGTAEVAGPDGKLSSLISDYSAIIPADNPRFVVTVVLKDPEGSYGGLTAGPVFAQIGEFLMQKYEVPNSPQRKNAIPVEW